MSDEKRVYMFWTVDANHVRTEWRSLTAWQAKTMYSITDKARQDLLEYGWEEVK